MAGELTLDQQAFLNGLKAALKDMKDHDGAAFLHEMGARGLAVAHGRVPVGATGELAGSLGMRAGEDEGGPYVEFGVMSGGHANEIGFYMEFGTYKDRARGFMRAAMAEIGGGAAGVGGVVKRAATVRARGVRLRASKRGTIRSFRRTGGITSAEARMTSRQVSSKFQLRNRGGRSWISNTKIRGR